MIGSFLWKKWCYIYTYTYTYSRFWDLKIQNNQSWDAIILRGGYYLGARGERVCKDSNRNKSVEMLQPGWSMLKGSRWWFQILDISSPKFFWKAGCFTTTRFLERIGQSQTTAWFLFVTYGIFVNVCQKKQRHGQDFQFLWPGENLSS